jgi:hypothetical protein
VTTKRRKLIAFVLLALISGVIAYPLLRENDEPKYQGRRLSEWLAPYGRACYLDPAAAYEIRSAVQNIGTNAVPDLSKWLSYDPPAWRKSVPRMLPAFIRNRETVARWFEGEATRRANSATMGFAFLGTNAASAIPALEVLIKDKTKPERLERAIGALCNIGSPAIPTLRACLRDPALAKLTNSSPVMRAALITAIADIREKRRLASVSTTNDPSGTPPEVLTNAAPTARLTR